MAKSYAEKLFEAHLTQVKRLTEGNGVRGLARLYREARAELAARLLGSGVASGSVTQMQLREMLTQVDAVLEYLGSNVQTHLTDVSKQATRLGAKHGIDEYRKLSRFFTGAFPTVDVDVPAVFEGMVKGVDESLLRRYRVLSRGWSAQAVASVERALSVGALSGKPLRSMVSDVMKKTGIMEEQRWRAERIVRTETAYAHGAAKHESMRRTRDEVGESKLQKRLIETFDNRTGDDSFLLHGQTVPVDQPFKWRHKVRGQWVTTEFMHPPNRPNDRAVVIPWNPEWEETDGERPLSRSELASAAPTRWRKKAGVRIPPGHKPGRAYA